MARLTTPAGLVFDLDETLVDSRSHILNYQRDLFRELGRAFPEDEAEQFFTLDKQSLERRFFSAEDLRRIEAWRRENPYDARLGEIVPIRGADVLLRRLAGQGTPMAILSNRGTSTPRLLHMLGWNDWFNPVFSADIALRPKPDPWGLIEVARRWQTDPARLVFIGDSALDVACARAAGSLAVRVGERTQGGDVELPDLTALTDWLQTQGWLPAEDD